jgi:peptide/nickel transport system ATP-binding protein
VSFSLRRSTVLALVGESGSGKSTTARLIARLMPPTSGEIVYNGVDVLKTEPKKASLAYRREVQMIFQDPFGSLNPVHTIGHHLERPLTIHRRSKGGKELRERVLSLLSTVGLNPPSDFEAKYPHQLSGGQRQRVAFARALAAEPTVMLADEPISMLDVSIRMGILNLMHSLKEERGISYLYITHDIASARYIADDIVVMYAGHMVEGAASDDLIQEAAHPYTKLLLSAVPNPTSPLSKRPSLARGEPPTIVGGFVGCPFVGRCPSAMPVCRETMPGRTQIASRHWVRCHLFGEGEAAPA